VIAMFGLTAACAPVQSKTHFQRWDEHAAKIAAEEPEAPEAGPAAKKATPAPAAKAPPPATEVYGSSGGASSTPPITNTSTKSRVVRPGDQPAASPADEDVIY